MRVDERERMCECVCVCVCVCADERERIVCMHVCVCVCVCVCVHEQMCHWVGVENKNEGCSGFFIIFMSFLKTFFLLYH